MGYVSLKNIINITVLFSSVMFLSCKNDVRDVYAIPQSGNRPEMTVSNMTLIYSDSSRVKYVVKTPKYIKINNGKDKYEYFPEGIQVVSYDTEGKVIGSIRSNWAKNLEEEKLWEARSEVVAVNEDGTKVETEQMFWDMKKGNIYSDAYTRITSGDRIIEGNDGFESDQDMKNPVIKNITGIVEFDKEQ